jgi:hypothetical protein
MKNDLSALERANRVGRSFAGWITMNHGGSRAPQSLYDRYLQHASRHGRLTLGSAAMLKPMIIVTCVFAAYFILIWIFLGYWGQALMTGLLATFVFSIALLAASLVAQGRPWRAFWIANAVLIAAFGGIELLGLLTIKDNHATRFGGALLSVDGQITAAGYASLAFDVAICSLCNFLGFYLSRIFMKRFNVQ